MTEEGSVSHPGVCIWLTGLSGSGKSTTATVLAERLAANGCRVRVLDGDVVRAQRSTRLGFSRADREANALAVAQVAAAAIALGEIAICALISPYRETRDHVRAMIGPASFIEVFMDTPLALCEARDVKGLYRRAREGALTSVTGIDDPYEPPLAPDVRLTTATTTPQENVETLLHLLEGRGVLSRCVPRR